MEATLQLGRRDKTQIGLHVAEHEPDNPPPNPIIKKSPNLFSQADGKEIGSSMQTGQCMPNGDGAHNSRRSHQNKQRNACGDAEEPLRRHNPKVQVSSAARWAEHGCHRGTSGPTCQHWSCRRMEGWQQKPKQRRAAMLRRLAFVSSSGELNLPPPLFGKLQGGEKT